MAGDGRSLPLPEVGWVRQAVVGPVVDDVAAEVTAGINTTDLATRVKPGQSVAITGGSRGITDIAVVLRTVAAHLRSLGAHPFVVPAMGSHGGGTAEGQVRVLESCGVSESTVGCPVRSSMEVVELGRCALGFRLWQDRLAAEADHLVVCNRVKPHTMFAGPVESGLAKMLLVGLGKQRGAAEVHRAVMEHGWEKVITVATPEVIERSALACGVAVVERSDERTARVAVLEPHEWTTQEPALLDQAREWMPRVPFPDVDLLLLDRIGKNISGAGLDTNVVGRKANAHPPPWVPHGGIRCIAIRGLTTETQGNAVGVGLAELARSRVLREMDVASTRLNALTAGDLAPAMLPLDFETDREILDVAMGQLGLREPSRARLVWARNTLELTETLCSAALLEDAVQHCLEVIGEPFALPFDEVGNLPDDLPPILT
ncbi:MAG: lactate racemase domain-containing protein [Acidimicrobiales bacterium]